MGLKRQTWTTSAPGRSPRATPRRPTRTPGALSTASSTSTTARVCSAAGNWTSRATSGRPTATGQRSSRDRPMPPAPWTGRGAISERPDHIKEPPAGRAAAASHAGRTRRRGPVILQAGAGRHWRSDAVVNGLVRPGRHLLTQRIIWVALATNPRTIVPRIGMAIRPRPGRPSKRTSV